MVFARAAVLGVGLLGASFARAAKKRGLCASVTGFGRSEANLKRAVELGYIDDYSTDAAEAVRGAQLIVLCTPVERFEAIVSGIAGSLEPGALVIDVGSLKGAIISRIQEIMPDGAEFVGCHPIAGSDRSGIDASSEALFQDALCVVCPAKRNTKAGVEKASAVWKALGARVVELEPDEHDRIYGLVSHFPHAAAFAMVNTIGAVDGKSLEFAGPGFMDSTRIAASSAELWSGICLLNRTNIIEFIELYIKNLGEICDALEDEDREALKGIFGRARALRENLGDKT